MRSTQHILVTIIAICLATTSVFAAKKKKEDKDKKGKAPKAQLSVRYKGEFRDGVRVHIITVKGASSGAVYAIYKHPADGGVYSRQKEEFGSAEGKGGKKGKKGGKKGKKGKKGEKAGEAEKADPVGKKKRDKKGGKDAGKSTPQEFVFEHEVDGNKYYDYVVVSGDQVRASNPRWADVIEKIKDNEGTFGSDGEPKEAEEVTETAK